MLCAAIAVENVATSRTAADSKSSIALRHWPPRMHAVCARLYEYAVGSWPASGIVSSSRSAAAHCEPEVLWIARWKTVRDGAGSSC